MTDTSAHRQHLGGTGRAPRAVGAALALALLLPPAPAAAGDKQFASGSIIIPASVEYQSDEGILATYGLVYVTLQRNAARIAAGKRPVTLYWAVQPAKLSQYRCNTMTSDLPQYSPTYNDNDGCDLVVQRAVADGGQPVARLDPAGVEETNFRVNRIQYVVGRGPTRSAATHTIDGSTSVVKYLGGVWIVDATDRQAFLEMLATDPGLAPFHRNGTGSSLYVNLHAAKAAFTAPIVSVLSEKPPPIALIGSNMTAFLVNVLDNAGISAAIPNAGGTFSGAAYTAGVVYDYFPASADLLGASAMYPQGRLNAWDYGTLWAGDGAVPTAAEIARIAPFLDAGNTLFAEYDSPYHIENTASRLQTDAGLSDFNPNIASYEDCHDSTPGTTFFRGNGGTCLVADGANNPYAQTGNFLFDGGQGSYKGYTPISSFAAGVTQLLRVGGGGPTVASAWNKDNDPDKGLVLYLAGHKFDNGRFWGQRIILNSIFARLNAAAPTEIARSEPVAYKNAAANTHRVYQGTYLQRPLQVANNVLTYNPAAPQVWRFPYTEGHLYEYDLGGLSTAAQGFSSSTRWDAGAVMAQTSPGARTLFTAVAGSANLGWRRIEFSHRETTPGSCTADAGGVCRLSRLLAACNAAGVTTAMLTDAAQQAAAAEKLGMLVQQARGFCSSHTPRITGTPNYEPTDAMCDSPRQPNRPRLGGIDHGSPALVGPSRYVTEAAWMSSRPVVAYAAGHDGMLHAFFVSTADGAATGSWTAEGRSLPAGVRAGQELWAFVPPGQICGIATNNALVDGSINVVDAFGDFPTDANGDGVFDLTDPRERPTGIRRWRTVLTAAAGPGGSEIFALDVTNPLRPALLWHVGGPTENDGRWDTDGDGLFGPGEAFDVPDRTNPATYALKWHDWDDADPATTWIPADYLTTSAADVDAMKTGRYDYRNLGLGYATSIAKLWRGSSYQYAIFVATSAADHASGTPTGYRGVEVFAIELVTGRKLWQWEHRYAASSASGIDNSIPPGVALGDIDANGSTDRIYVGDMEGHLWELSARDGRNLNYLPASDGTTRSFPLFGTDVMTGVGPPEATAATKALYAVGAGSLGQQPLTTPIGEGRFTSVPASADASRFDPSLLLNRLSLVVGTMGVDWAIAPAEPGHLYALPVYPDVGTRRAVPVDLAVGDPLNRGVLKPNAVWDIPLDVGERVYGMPRVANNVIVFNTAFGSFTGDISATVWDPGNLKIVTAASTTTRANDSKAFGGAVLVGGTLVVTTDTSIRVAANPPAALSGGGTAQATFNRTTPAIVKTWEQVSP